MVSTLPLMALKFNDFSIKNNWPKILLVLIAIISLFILKWLAIPVVVLAYVLISLLFKTKSV
jgi:CDP-diacylglycerol--serine O-phosphatidyltransferase